MARTIADIDEAILKLQAEKLEMARKQLPEMTKQTHSNYDELKDMVKGMIKNIQGIEIE